VLGDPDLDAQVRDLSGRLNFEVLWRSEVALPALIDQFSRFRDRYALAYRKAHRDFHTQLQTIDELLAGLGDKLTVLDRLNGLELGAPVGAGLARDVAELRGRVHPCALKDDCRVDERPRCDACRWGGEGTPPRDEAQRLATRVADASGELCKRVAQDAVRNIFDASGSADIRTLLDMITASRIEDLVRVLTPDLVEQLKGLLAAANVEHRELRVGGLIEDFVAVEEDQIDALLGRLRERLRQEFDKAKRETAGKKRIRFLLK